jgi:hypothetical protein
MGIYPITLNENISFCTNDFINPGFQRTVELWKTVEKDK